MAVIETARPLGKLAGAGSTEFGPCEHPVTRLDEPSGCAAGNDWNSVLRTAISVVRCGLGAYEAVLDHLKVGRPAFMVKPASARGTASL